MTTELAIEREANIRAQKKKILQLQRLKYLSGKLEIPDDNVTAAETDNKQFLFAQGRGEKSSDLHVMKEKKPAVACEITEERLTNNLATGDNYGKVSELERGETQKYTPSIRPPVSPRRERQTAEDITENHETETKTDGAKISIVVENAEPERYTPSFASGSSEYRLKTTEIKKKVDERRRNVISSSYRHSSLLHLPSNNGHLTVLQPRRSASLTELHCQRSNHDDDFDTKRANTSHRSRSKSEEMKVRSYASFALSELEPPPALQRASSLSSIYDSCPKTEKEGINFEGFARRQQERLEDNLRRVEENLDSTFSTLRRYVNATSAILETVKLKDTT